MNLELIIRICVHIALENSPTIKVTTYEFLDQNDAAGPIISSIILNTLENLPLLEVSQRESILLLVYLPSDSV